MAARVTQPAVAARPARRLPRGARLRCGGDRTLVLALAGTTALAFVLRVRALGESFWYDEAYSAYIAAQPALRALELIPTTESTPPLYYALAWLWTRVFGAGEVALRSLSLATGLATVLVLSLLGRELAPAGRERTAAVACALVAASSPLLAWYAGEARAYALLALLCALAALFFVRFLREPNGRWAWRYGATATAALATHYFALFVVAPQIAMLLVRYRKRSALPAAALPVAGALALAPLAVAQLDSRRSDWIGTLPLAGRTWHAAVHFAAGFRPPSLVAWPLVALCWGGVALVAIRPPARKRRPRTDPRAARARRPCGSAPSRFLRARPRAHPQPARRLAGLGSSRHGSSGGSRGALAALSRRGARRLVRGERAAR